MKSRRWIPLLTILLLCLILVLRASAQNDQNTRYLPLVVVNRPAPPNLPPSWSTSYYIDMPVLDLDVMGQLGCEIGTRHASSPGVQDELVVLDFGKPTYQNGEYGASLLYRLGHAPVSAIAEAVEEYADFYRLCSQSDPNSNLVIGVGTSNYDVNVTYGHGAAWAAMVNTVNNWLINKGYFTKVIAYGASDMEISWNTPAITRAWVNGYDSANLYPLINFGDAAGCPTRLSDQGDLTCNPGWVLEDLWYISFGVGSAYPLPLIYANPNQYYPQSSVNAAQWARMGKYGYDIHGARVDFLGAMTQYQSCLQVPDDASCELLDNTPEEGVQYLYYELSLYPPITQALRYSTDIKWWDPP
jgi:hypothetical protein